MDARRPPARRRWYGRPVDGPLGDHLAPLRDEDGVATEALGVDVVEQPGSRVADQRDRRAVQLSQLRRQRVHPRRHVADRRVIDLFEADPAHQWVVPEDIDLVGAAAVGGADDLVHQRRVGWGAVHDHGLALGDVCGDLDGELGQSLQACGVRIRHRASLRAPTLTRRRATRD